MTIDEETGPMRRPGRGRATRLLAAIGTTGAILVALSGCSGDAPEPSPSLPLAAATPVWKLPDGPLIVFRNTEPGPHAGRVASVPLASPGSQRTTFDRTCDRLSATRVALSCMSTTDSDPVGYRETLYDIAGTELRSWPLPGPPSRTRLSADSKLAAWTAFVDGESYANVAFSTQTIITEFQGTYYGSLDTFTLFVDAKPYVVPDLNYWGVTFADDDNTFYATASSAGHNWLVLGNLRGRTVSALRVGVECPSVSPDGTRVAFKKNLGTADAPRWTLAVYDLTSKTETQLPLTASVDDQAEWMDDHTLLFGVPVAGATDDFNVFSVPADGSASETLLIEHAWSPSVVR